MTHNEILRRAAKVLDREAQTIYDCNTCDDQWIEGTASERGDYEELIELADALLRMADAPDPLGEALNSGDGVYRP
jgi:hypothetical protein